ncbi:hypothetical protein EIN_170790 [Entamoeba invadens IP1]|uniref:Uncharacterized protein n=1 Tax=Entamoeba invadens IP1 TaxID=370355 RepID=A0A0A1TVN5_ENTIV|nr:hypothetical protein EIN_170790 [Entamoeba invadens IP1]ELP84544.1 hypothetical protein EIN_170790 [Entamoeba invadens IP1]|eukprot:XP_004183890.1 hypothetical protein EIN_170790 [Entamoeba invadens IP1]
MSWENTQATILIEGFHLDMGNDHHRSFQDILIHVCEYGTVCLRSASIIETNAKQLPPDKYQKLVEQVSENVKSLNDPISKLCSIVEAECDNLVHPSIKELTTSKLDDLKKIVAEFTSKVNSLTFTDIKNAISDVIQQTFLVMQIVMSDTAETLCDNCDCIQRNIDKLLLLEGEVFAKGCRLVAAQMVNGIGLPMRERGGDSCSDVANCIDAISERLCKEGEVACVAECKAVIERSKEVFRKTVKPFKVQINTGVIEKSCSSAVFPIFNDATMANLVDTEKKDEIAKENYVKDYYIENVKKLDIVYVGLTKGIAQNEFENVELSQLVDVIHQKMEGLDEKLNEECIMNNPHLAVTLDNQMDTHVL